jgi:hypothetical protein
MRQALLASGLRTLELRHIRCILHPYGFGQTQLALWPKESEKEQ